MATIRGTRIGSGVAVVPVVLSATMSATGVATNQTAGKVGDAGNA